MQACYDAVFLVGSSLFACAHQPKKMKGYYLRCLMLLESMSKATRGDSERPCRLRDGCCLPALTAVQCCQR